MDEPEHPDGLLWRRVAGLSPVFKIAGRRGDGAFESMLIMSRTEKK
jgi:hypothetical protein